MYDNNINEYSCTGATKNDTLHGVQANVADRSVTADHKTLLVKAIGSSTRRSVAAATLGPALLAFRRGTNL